MDKQLHNYMHHAEAAPPPLSEATLESILYARRQRQLLLAAAFASLTLAVSFAAMLFRLYDINPAAATTGLCIFAAGIAGAGIFAACVLYTQKKQFKKKAGAIQ